MLENYDNWESIEDNSQEDASEEGNLEDNLTKLLMSKDSNEVDTYLEHMGQWSMSSKKKVVHTLLDTIMKHHAEKATHEEMSEINRLKKLLKSEHKIQNEIERYNTMRSKN